MRKKQIVRKRKKTKRQEFAKPVADAMQKLVANGEFKKALVLSEIHDRFLSDKPMPIDEVERFKRSLRELNCYP